MFAEMFRAPKHALMNRLCADRHWPESHRHFFVTQIVSSTLAFSVFPLWILWRGAFTVDMAMVFCWLSGPMLAAVVLVRSRSLGAAFFVSAAFLTGLICTICAFTGGMRSFALIWLLVIPLEAVLSNRRWSVLGALIPITAGTGFLLHGDATGLFDIHPAITASQPTGFFLGPVSVVIYTALLMMRIQAMNNRNQAHLARTEECYRLLADNSMEIVIRHDITGKVVFASPAAKSVVGVAADELLGTGLFEKVHVADRPIYLRAINDAAVNGQHTNDEFRLKTIKSAVDTYRSSVHLDVDFDYIWMEMNSRPIWGEDGTIIGVVSAIRNISERKSHEEELHEAHENLKELSDTKSRFLANMSHELRTPLNAIIGFSEILQQELFGKLENEKQKEYINLIHESGQHLLQVVTDVLDVSKIESGTFDILPEAFDVNKLVQTCTSIMSQQAEKRSIELKMLVPENLPEAVADSRACRQILINLISNALKFSDENSRVIVGVRLEGPNLAYFVRDKGIGMSEDDAKRVGQPFFQVDSTRDRRYEGTGLGVSVVKGLAELHNGRVEIESKLGEGTCVTVFIPLDCEAEPNDDTIEMIDDAKHQDDEMIPSPTITMIDRDMRLGARG